MKTTRISRQPQTPTTKMPRSHVTLPPQITEARRSEGQRCPRNLQNCYGAHFQGQPIGLTLLNLVARAASCPPSRVASGPQQRNSVTLLKYSYPISNLVPVSPLCSPSKNLFLSIPHCRSSCMYTLLRLHDMNLI